METLRAQATQIGPVRTRDNLADLQAQLLSAVVTQLSDKMQALVDRLANEERKALKDQQARAVPPAQQVLRVPRVQKATMALRVQADINMGTEDIMDTPAGMAVTNKGGTTHTLEVTVERATVTAARITAGMVTEAMTDMLLQTTAMPMNMAADTAVMLDMEATLEVSTEATDIRTAMKEMMLALGIPTDIVETVTEEEKVDTPTETAEADTVIVATGAASKDSPWKL